RGATDFTYRIAEQFDLKITKPKPGLVPLVLDSNKNLDFKSLRGISFNAEVYNDKISFKEAILFTHKGMSGPAILQISNYLDGKKEFNIRLEPDLDLPGYFEKERRSGLLVKTSLSHHLSSRFANEWAEYHNFNCTPKQLNDPEFDRLI